MGLRGNYITECLKEINRRIGYIEELEEQFKKSMDTGITNLKSNEEIDDILHEINRKLNNMREELDSARSKLVNDLSDIGGWL